MKCLPDARHRDSDGHLSAIRPDWRLPERAGVDELFKNPAHKAAAFD
jgi:hypothetical protein